MGTSGEKLCRACNQVLSVDSFRFVQAGQGYEYKGKYYGGQCKGCDTKRARKYVVENFDLVKDKRLKKQYGCSLIDYNMMVSACNNTCYICGAHGTKRKPLVVDHDHKSNLIRGVICYKCNHGIGYLKDSPENLERAAQYLRNFYYGKRINSTNTG